MLKMMISDVDDTLLRDKLSTELKDAVMHANNKGVEFVLCSGRPTINLRRLADEFNKHGAKINYISGFNGSEIIDINTDTVIYNNGFNSEEVEMIVSKLDYANIDYCLYQGENVVANNVNNEYAIYEAKLNSLDVIEHTKVIGSNKILGFSQPECTDENVAKLKQLFPSLQINKSKPFFIEITKLGVNKALPVKVLSELLDIELEHCAVCGDGDNDLAMFELAVGYKYVVANGSDNLKKHAHIVIDSVDNNGVAKQLMELL